MKLFDKFRKTASENQPLQGDEGDAANEEWIRVDGKLVKVEGAHEDGQKGQ